MGWKGSLRSINAASRRAQKESERNQRSLDRSLSKVDRDMEKVFRKCYTLENQLEKDIIKALNISYVEYAGFTSTPFLIESDLFSCSINLLVSEKDHSDSFLFDPNIYTIGNVCIEALDIMVTQWATLIAFKVQHQEMNYRLRLNWFKKSVPEESAIYILDPVNSEYYYPIASDLKGEVLSGHPKVGIMAFETFRQPTPKIQIHFSGVKVSPSRGSKETFLFESTEDEKLKEVIEEAICKPGLSEQISSIAYAEERKLKNKIHAAHSGCLVPILIGGSAMLTGLLWSMLKYVVPTFG